MTLLGRIVFSIALCASCTAHAQMPRRTPQQQRDAIELESATRDAARLRQEHCAQVGAAACAREDREGAAFMRAAQERGRAQHCREVGWPRCEQEEADEAASARREIWIPAVCFVVLIVLLFRVTRRPSLVRPPTAASIEAPMEKSDVAVLDVVLPRREADALRAEIDRELAAAGSAATALPQIARAILSTREHWSALSVLGWPMQTTDAAWMRWRGLRDEVRARPSIEVAPPEPRIGNGYRDGPAPLPAHETEAHAVLSMVVLSKRELRETPGDPPERALALLATIGSLRVDEIEGVELTWLPDDAREEHTLRDLQARIPRLVAIG